MSKQESSKAFGYYNRKNLESIEIGIPALFTASGKYKSGHEYINNILYFKNHENELVVFASISLEMVSSIDSEYRIFKNAGYSGAYPGFGELLYLATLIELERCNGYLMPDIMGLTDSAAKMYEKLRVTDFIATQAIDVVDNLTPQFANLAYVGNIDIYKTSATTDAISLHDSLLKNNQLNQLTDDEINDLKMQAYDLGESMLAENNIVDREALMQRLKEGHNHFSFNQEQAVIDDFGQNEMELNRFQP